MHKRAYRRVRGCPALPADTRNPGRADQVDPSSDIGAPQPGHDGTFLSALVVLLPYDQRVATRPDEIQGVRPAARRPRPANGSRIAAASFASAPHHVQDRGPRAPCGARRPRTCPPRTLGVGCLLERTTRHGKQAQTRNANRKPRKVTTRLRRSPDLPDSGGGSAGSNPAGGTTR